MADTATPDPQPVWTPYEPDDCIGDFGWLWLDGPMGHEWVLVYTGTDDPDCPEGVLLDLIGRQDDYGACESITASRFAGTPYLGLLQPTIEPGKCDSLEVAVRFAPGASVTNAFGNTARLEAVKAATFAAMGLGRVEDG